MLQILDNKFELSAKSIPKKSKRLQIYSNFYKNTDINFADSTKHKLSDFKSKTLIVNFWASWCIPCLEEMPTLINLEKKYKDVKVVYVAEDEKSSIKKARKLVKQFGIKKSQLVYDFDMNISNKFNVNSVPFTVVFQNGIAKLYFIESNDFMADSFIEKLNLSLKTKK